ncbi:uncharacterized protein [Henckelia pumila]|uniref:uncharacterized protein n=1 Tax=Henckelia pumila TaxID=405737 RepID=UPI003C6E565D
MDKEWMSKSRLSREYEHGVEYFLKFAIKNAEDREAISCPCTKCGNLKKKKLETIRAHMYSNGIDLTYHTWIWHGERSAMKNSNNDRDQEREDVPKFDAEEPIDMVHAAFDSYAENPTTFKNLLEDAEKPLYPGCSKFTRLSAVVKLFNLKAKYSWSDKSCTDLLNLLGEMLRDDNELPLSFYDAKKSLCALGITYEKIHACPNDCILYRKEYEDMNSCPTCGMSRWKMGQKDTIKEGVLAKVLWYFPPIPRFVRMFRNKEFSKELTWHADKRLNDGYLRHPADEPSWKLVDHKWPNFAADSRNLRLASSADGINPHGMMSSTYSCWPILMITYNLPPWLCMKRKFMMLTMLISGPKQPGNDIDVYLEPLIDDLKFLWDTGVEAYDVGKLARCIVKGYHACPICGEETYSTRLKRSRKMSYTGHRRFLPANNPYRRQRKAFNGYQEFNPAPKPLSGDEVLIKVDGIHCHWGKMRKKIQSTKDDVKPSFKKKSIFFELEYWKHLFVRHVLDVIHIEKNVCESLLGTLLDIPGKTKDGIAARLDLAEMNLRTDLALVMGEKKSFLPAACYTLTKDEKRKILNSLCGMQLPTCYSSNVKNFVSMKDLKLVGLKSHDYHTLMQQLLPVAIRGVLPKHVRDSITRLCFFFNELCNKVMDPSKLDELQREIVIILCLLEKYFPPSFFDIMIHLTVHLVREVKLCGPVWYRYMYPFERYMKILKGYVRNRNRPEGCMAECYIAEEAVEFCSDYLGSLHTIGIPTSHRQIELTKPLSAAIVQSIAEDELQQEHRYVLENDVDTDRYIEEHMAYLNARFPQRAKSKRWLQDEHNRTFSTWLLDRVACVDDHSTYQVSERLKWMARGPSKQVLKYSSYLIDRVTYATRERDDMRVVQNSGVSLVAKTMQVSSAKDKHPIVSDMVDDLGFTLVNLHRIGYKSDSFILASQAKQVFYIEAPEDPLWSVVLATPSREYFEYTKGEELEETAMHYQSSSRGLAPMDVDVADDNEPCIREDCDGIWVLASEKLLENKYKAAQRSKEVPD